MTSKTVAQMDQSCFNDVLANPTAEAIVVWIWDRVVPQLRSLVELRLWETADCHVVYRGEPMPPELTAAEKGALSRRLKQADDPKEEQV